MRARNRTLAAAVLFALTAQPSMAGQAPGPASASDIPVSSRDRVYLSDQTSNTVSVVNPATNQLLGVIRLGQADAGTLSPLYTGQLLVHGMGFSSDHRTLDVISVGSNSVTFIDTLTNRVKHVTYVGRSPHEAFFTPDDKEVWVSVRGEDYVAVIDAATYREVRRIAVPYGPGMVIFSHDGRYGYLCSSFTPETVVIGRASHTIIGHVKQVSPFCPDIAATPDGTQVWETLKDTGRVEVFNAKPPFNVLSVLDTGPITNHVNFARNANGQFAYVTIGGLNEVKVFTTGEQPKLVATISTGELPHGIWPSGDGTRMYVGLENADGVAAIDTLTNHVIATVHSGQSPQGIAYVPNAVPTGDGGSNLEPLGSAGAAAHLVLVDASAGMQRTTVTVNNQGLTDLLEAAVTGLVPGGFYVLELAERADGSGTRTRLATFKANPSGAAIVTSITQLRAMVSPDADVRAKRYLVIAEDTNGSDGRVVQIQK
ncbi:MAG: YncE family protein [Candidatus Eremiobacteraeota bacterium]|nr:YncE family protein [Candidatus Eremiobacteraeota bacterium]